MDRRERDRDLVGRTVGGDNDAFGELCRLYYEPLRRYVGSRLVYADLVDDVVQTSFLRVSRILPEHEADTPFWPFLQQVARRVVYEELRAARRFPDRTEDPILEALAERHADRMAAGTDDRLEKQMEAMERCFRKLSERAQTLFRKLYSEGVKVQELARELGVKANAISAQLYRWRAELTRCVSRTAEEFS